MATYKTVNTLTTTNAAYIAGFVDGEGTITLTKEHKNERKRLVVSISNTERELLDIVLEAVGAGKITSKRVYAERHTPSFVYKITNRQALALLQQLSPYLRSYKAKRAQYALKHYIEVTPRNGRYTDSLSKARNQFEAEFMAILPNKPV